MSGGSPWLSVVLIVRDPADSPAAVLNALAAEPGIEECEVICMDGRPGAAFVDDPLPAGVLRREARPGLSMPSLKAEGARIARAASVGFLEPKGVPLPGWLAVARQALEAAPKELIGGAVCFDGAVTGANQAAFIFEYGDLTPAMLASGTVRDLSGNNMILPREALLTHCADILERDGLNKPFCQARLLEAGYELRTVPALQIGLKTAHRVVPLFTSRMFYGRCFGGTRARRASTRQRWLYRAAAPAVPVLLARRHLARMAREDWPAAWRTKMALSGLCVAWSLGEGLGSWAGPGNACEKLY